MTESHLADRWLRRSGVLLATYLVFVLIVQARPGLPAVVLWYVMPPLLVVTAAWLLGLALGRTWRSGDVPDGRQLAGYAALLILVGSLALFRIYPSSHDDRVSRVRFRVPLDGAVTVAWGGRTLAQNYHAVMPDQRWAYDLLVTEQGRSYAGDGTRLADYYVYGREVVAPADGVVHAVHDGEPDGAIGQRRLFRAFGNHVVLAVAPGEYLFIAHLQPGSIRVRTGDRVGAGDPIGAVGNSGNSSEPHVHLHVQDRLTTVVAEAIPFEFSGYRTGGQYVASGMPRGGRARRRGGGSAFVGETIEHVRTETPATSLRGADARRVG